MRLDPNERPDSVYRTLSSIVVPRPIGWISTVDKNGVENLAPYSFFNAVCADPPTVMFSAHDATEDGELKDTPRNALDTGEFVTNLVTEEVLMAMDESSKPTNDDEFEFTDLERIPAETVTPSRVVASLASLECSVVDSLRVGTNLLVFGRVKLFHVDDSLVTDDDVDAAKVKAIGRYGGPYYARQKIHEYTRSY